MVLSAIFGKAMVKENWKQDFQNFLRVSNLKQYIVIFPLISALKNMEK